MDRDHRWDRTEKWYDSAVRGAGPRRPIRSQWSREAYERDETDEFVVPTAIVDETGKPVAPMRDGDAVICFNYRSDRMRQIVRALTDAGLRRLRRRATAPTCTVATMTMYDQTFDRARSPSRRSRWRASSARWCPSAGLTMLRTAETEKYAHVTYFFNGGVETPFPGEERRLVPSQKVATYDLAPEMSAPGITDVLVRGDRRRSEHDFILCNYANARHGRAHRLDAGDDQGGGDGGRVPGARARGRRARRARDCSSRPTTATAR